MIRRINPVLPELLTGIAVYGLVLQIVGIWFMDDKLQYSVGLWIGIAIAAGMAINMAIVILDSVDLMAEHRAPLKTALYSLLRYVLVVLAFVIVWYFKLGNPVVMFVGVMGLKISAYLQPFTHKILTKRKGRGDESADKI